MTQIIFNSQEEFEDAVMDVLCNRLRIEVFASEFVKIRLVDRVDGVEEWITSNTSI